MIDPFAEVVALLQPGAPLSKVVAGAGAWRVRRSDMGQPFYCAILEGGCLLTLDRRMPIPLREGDFVLIPAAHDFAMSSIAPVDQEFDAPPLALGAGELRLGVAHGPHDVRLIVGHCVFGSPDAALLVSLLPELIHVHGARRLASLVELVRDESREQRPARDIVLQKMLEVLLIEAIRSHEVKPASKGLLRGLADERLAAALRGMHRVPNQAWTVALLAREAALSRSAFFARFTDAMGIAPMKYLLTWRMALAKNLLRNDCRIADVAERVGYSSASAFSVAFSRHVGMAPVHYARQ
ncbi:AraC family transcriptional regulator [Duganella vulcania]|uniref:Helix-turn-helix domain-containing protein n=1 Tax=Duganella vulcania TaxID=2692166 RepID=A0A845GRY6_9BURK|nr:AraC family transcriptional regulator [Duganella vulcania]MYM97064.1 helix-turn-helix domain-containing protein [Duganella vulcania]